MSWAMLHLLDISIGWPRWIKPPPERSARASHGGCALSVHHLYEAVRLTPAGAPDDSPLLPPPCPSRVITSLLLVGAVTVTWCLPSAVTSVIAPRALARGEDCGCLDEQRARCIGGAVAEA